MVKKFVVIGNPIAHSRSPQIHQSFAEQFNLKIQYERLLVKEGELKQALENFYAEGGVGANITLPHKEDAYRLCSEIAERSQVAKAVNTIRFLEGGKLHGDNTDGIGFVNDLMKNYAVGINNKKILILGAGGGVRGILPAIIQQHPQSITIANRTASRAEKLAEEFAPLAKITVVNIDHIQDKFDLVINGTAAGMLKQELHLPREILGPNAICYDLAYGPAADIFLTWARENDAALCIDGLGMLVEQAAEGFYCWNHCRPDTRIVLDELRNSKS